MMEPKRVFDLIREHVALDRKLVELDEESGRLRLSPAEVHAAAKKPTSAQASIRGARGRPCPASCRGTGRLDGWVGPCGQARGGRPGDCGAVDPVGGPRRGHDGRRLGHGPAGRRRGRGRVSVQAGLTLPKSNGRKDSGRDCHAMECIALYRCGRLTNDLTTWKGRRNGD